MENSEMENGQLLHFQCILLSVGCFSYLGEDNLKLLRPSAAMLPSQPRLSGYQSDVITL